MWFQELLFLYMQQCCHGGLERENWHCHSCHFYSQRLIVRQYGGINCPYSCPTNRVGVPCHSAPHFTLIHAAGIYYLCFSGKGRIQFCPYFTSSTLQTQRVEPAHSGHVFCQKIAPSWRCFKPGLVLHEYTSCGYVN